MMSDSVIWIFLKNDDAHPECNAIILLCWKPRKANKQTNKKHPCMLTG